MYYDQKKKTKLITPGNEGGAGRHDQKRTSLLDELSSIALGSNQEEEDGGEESDEETVDEEPAVMGVMSIG